MLDFAAIARQVICDIGYDTGDFGFDGNAVGVITALDRQSADIARGVDASHDTRNLGSTDPFDSAGAGDQGMMFGYATSETPELMPTPIVLAHKLARLLAQVRREGLLPYLRPDGKTEVTVRYDADGRPTAVEKVLISTQHEDGVEAKLPDALWEQVVTQELPPGLHDAGGAAQGVHRQPDRPVRDRRTGRRHRPDRPQIIVDTYAGSPGTAAAPSPARTPPRWTGPPPTRRGTWPRTSWPPGSPTGPRSRWPTRSGSPGRCPCSSRPSVPRKSAEPGSPTWSVTTSTCGPPPWWRR